MTRSPFSSHSAQLSSFESQLLAADCDCTTFSRVLNLILVIAVDNRLNSLPSLRCDPRHRSRKQLGVKGPKLSWVYENVRLAAAARVVVTGVSAA